MVKHQTRLAETKIEIVMDEKLEWEFVSYHLKFRLFKDSSLIVKWQATFVISGYGCIGGYVIR